MKKLFALVLMSVISGGMILFADDAITLPARVGRITIAPAFVFSDGIYDDDWKRQSSNNDTMMLPVGIALEYGIIDWITAAIQWAPGINAWSKIDNMDDAKLFGFYDIFAGVKFQIIGEKAPIATKKMRLSLAPGVKAPLPGPDYKKQLENMIKGDSYTVANVDKHLLGVGARAYYDIVFNKNLFLNFYANFIYYPIKGDLEKSGLEGYGAAQGIKQLSDAGLIPAGIETDTKKIVNYGYDLTLEIEPRYTLPFDGLILNFCLPVSYDISPGKKYDIGDNHALKLANLVTDGNPSHLLSIRPGVSAMLTKTPLPLEFKLEYGLPIFGKNSTANHKVIFGIKAYIKI